MHPNRISFSPAIPTATLSSSQKSYPSSKQSQIFLAFPEAQNRDNHGPLVIRPARNKLKSVIRNSENGTSEPAVVISERSSAKSRKLEKRKKKEEGFQDAERNALLENVILSRTKEHLEGREREIAAASAKERKMAEDLEMTYNDLEYRSRQIEHLRLLVKEQETKITSSQSSLGLKEDEMNKLRNELIKKNEEAAAINSELRSREQLFSEADELIKEQKNKIQELQREVAAKEQDLSKSLQLRKAEEEKLKVAQASLEEQALEWLSAREELKQLTDQVTDQLSNVKGTSEDFGRVRSLLSEVRSELITTQESLTLSRRKIDDQSLQFAKQVSEVNKEKVLLSSFIESLKLAQEEVESEKTNLRAARAKYSELESHFTIETNLMESLQEELRTEQSLVKQQGEEIALLQNALQQKKLWYEEAQNTLQLKTSELLEARHHIGLLKAERASVQLMVQKLEFELLNAQKELADANHGIGEIQKLLNSQEDQLIQASTGLDKEEYISRMPLELDDTKQESDDTKLKLSEATSSITRIADLTDKIASSAKDKEISIRRLLNEENLSCDLHHVSDSRKELELESELGMTKELLREKDEKFLATQRDLGLKYEELTAVIRRSDAQEKEIEILKKELQDSNGTKKVDGSAQEGICDPVEAVVLNKEIQHKAGQLEAEAAISAVRGAAEIIHQLTEESGRHSHSDTNVLPKSTEDSEMSESSSTCLDKMEVLEEAEKAAAQLSASTELLLEQAGVTSS